MNETDKDVHRWVWDPLGERLVADLADRVSRIRGRDRDEVTTLLNRDFLRNGEGKRYGPTPYQRECWEERDKYKEKPVQ